MGAELGALAGVQAALEQGPENGRLDGRPVQVADVDQDVHTLAVQLQDPVVVEQAAVEMADLLGAEPAADRHSLEELAELGDKGLGLGAGVLDHAGEKSGRQQLGVFGEQAEQQTDQEMGNLLGILAVAAQDGSQAGKVAGGSLGDFIDGLAGFELFRPEEGVAQDRQLVRIGEVGQLDLVVLLDGVGEIGMDDDLIGVRDDQQRRVLERLAVLEQLVVSLLQIFMLAFVLPTEVAAVPDVGPAIAAFLLGDAIFEGEEIAFGIQIDRGFVPDQAAEVDEVFLAGRALFELDVAPFVDEFLGGDG